MKIGLFTYVHLDEQELLDFNLVYHYIKHYIKHGIFPKNITIIPYGYLNFEKNYEKFKDICTYYNIQIYPIENFPYDFMTAHNKFLEWQKIDGIKFDWLLKTDIDEFISYGYYTLYEYIRFLLKNEFDCGVGCFVDCIDKENKLKIVDKDIDIFEQFPKRYMLTKNVVKGYTYKVVIFKSDKIINVGNHSCITENVKIHNSISNKIYHFKWIYNLIHRIKINKTRKIFNGNEWATHEISNVESIIQENRLIL
jgi:hypothetical protein